MLRKIAPYLLFVVYKLFYFTWRIRIVESEDIISFVKENKSFIIAHWHGDELGILHLLKPYRVACIVSTSSDGELMNKAIHLLGGETARGSSTRGGTRALKGLLRLTKAGRRPSVAVDGPKGPIYKAKPGILQISRLTKLPIIPISFHSSNNYIFEKAWNKTKLPLPFSKITVVWGETQPIVQKDQDSRSEELCEKLNAAINSTKEKAAQLAQKI